MSTMTALRVDKKGHKINLIENHPIPKLISGEDDDKCICRVSLSGICGTDLHIIEDKFAAKDGVILGHEWVGTVVEISSKEKALKVGDRIAMNPNPTCGDCEQCRKNLPNFCRAGGMIYCVGISVDGGWAEFCKLRSNLCYKLPDCVAFEQAVVCEPMSCILHGIDVIPALVVGRQILVMGAGIIGLLWNSILHHLGHRNVYCVQSSAGRRTTFNNLNFGFEAMSWEDIERPKSGGCEYQFDVVIDTSGNTEALAKAMRLLKPGGTLVIFGVADPNKTLSISPFEMYLRELKIAACCINTHTSFKKAIDFIQATGTRYFTMEKLNMKAFPLKEHETAIKSLHDRMYTKVVFACDK